MGWNGWDPPDDCWEEPEEYSEPDADDFPEKEYPYADEIMDHGMDYRDSPY